MYSEYTRTNTMVPNYNTINLTWYPAGYPLLNLWCAPRGQIMDTNLRSCFLLTKGVAAIMTRAGTPGAPAPLPCLSPLSSHTYTHTPGASFALDLARRGPLSFPRGR